MARLPGILAPEVAKREAAARWMLLPRVVRWPVDMVALAFAYFSTDRCTTYAAAIAYYSVFSVVPLALLVLSVVGLFVDQDEIVDFVFEQIPLQDTPDVRADVTALVSDALSLRWAWLSVGTLTLLWSASGLFGGVRKGLNAWTPMYEQRSYFRSKLLDIALIPVVGGLVIVAVWSSVLIESLLSLVTSYGVVLVSALMMLGVFFAAFSIMYRVVPVVRPSWTEAMVSAVAAALLFEATKVAIGIVLNWTAGNDSNSYISAGAGYILGFLAWMFLNGAILLWSAEFGRAIFHGTVEGDVLSTWLTEGGREFQQQHLESASREGAVAGAPLAAAASPEGGIGKFNDEKVEKAPPGG